MKNFCICFLCLCTCLTVNGQSLHFTGICADESSHTYKWYIQAAGEGASEAATPLEVNENCFDSMISASPSGFYYLFGVSQQAQVSLPLYMPDMSHTYHVRLFMDGYCPRTDMDVDNRALSAFNHVNYDKSRNFWTNAPKMRVEEFFPVLKDYESVADSLGVNGPCSAPVKEFLKLWAYTSAYSCYANLPRLLERKDVDLPFTKEELLGNPLERLDTPVAACFPVSSYIVMQNLPKADMSEQIEYLRQHYSCESVRKRVEASLLDEYIHRFDYSQNFELGLKQLTELVEKYDLDKQAINSFKSRKSSIPGTLFPPEIVLTDIDGNKVDFGSFKGYYVYIDLWASWCGPCCKEAPYLIQLEKELANKKVKFVSISLDKKPDAWKKKSEELGLHGNQLLNQDNKLAETLNVKSIPFFMIYDKEGKLYLYNAPRPSSGEELKKLLEGLQ